MQPDRRENKSTDGRFGCLNSQVLADRADASDFLNSK